MDVLVDSLNLLPWNTSLSFAIKDAFKEPHLEQSGSCTLCRTDFSIQVSPYGVTVRVWQDMGSEGPPLYGEQRTHRVGGKVQIDWLSRGYHTAGSIRNKYEQPGK